ncbi:MAG: hypothetical protein A3F70_10020 [Acidobacteria bacterium RIFCSPLOWO2_12_FULL_67_14]|nr:MAG: hypothetical protein A3H29_00230 [Acidobacteria bacterium RIFCSPLOWO2_02_FULL_67_21]OFW38088.1 MAG: hypothetical protein A3F70_10020 [Acidobacteria bacterium RIFCSPLOWO2_12_FULL_67_14]
MSVGRDLQPPGVSISVHTDDKRFPRSIVLKDAFVESGDHPVEAVADTRICGKNHVVQRLFFNPHADAASRLDVP